MGAHAHERMWVRFLRRSELTLHPWSLLPIQVPRLGTDAEHTQIHLEHSMAGMPVRLATALTTPVTMESLLVALWDCKGSDLLITPGSSPILRLDGNLVRIDDVPLLT